MPSVKRPGRLIEAVLWTYGAQVATMVAQMAYAGFTSRLVDPEGFGIYAVALIVLGLFTVVSNGGVSQSVSRLATLDKPIISGLVTYSWILGTVSGLILLVSSPLWAHVWGNDRATAAVGIVASAAVMAPIAGLASGLMRRQGRFRFLAISLLSTNLLGMLVGVALVAVFRNGESLLGSVLVAQAALCLVLIPANGQYLLRFGSPRRSAGEVSFSSRVIASNIFAYINGALPKLAVSRLIGSQSLGYWNRADVLSTVPFFQIQNAIVQTVYPEFRHDIANGRRARVVWTNMLVLISFTVFPVIALGSAILPVLAPLILGPNWTQVSVIIPVLLVLAGLQVATTVLASAVEALAWFKTIWWTEAAVFALQIGVVASLYFTRSLLVGLGVMCIGMVVRHVCHIVVCVRNSYVDGRRLFKGYGVAIVTSQLIYVFTKSIMDVADDHTFYLPFLVGSGIILLGGLGLAFRLRASLDIFRYLRVVADRRRH